VLVLQWYPVRDAHGSPWRMELLIANDDPRLERFADVLSAYARTMFAHYVMDKPEAELDDAGRAGWKRHSANRPPALPTPSRPPVRSRLLCTTAVQARRLRTRRCAGISRATATSCGERLSRADGRSLNIDGFAVGRGCAVSR
jgi:hypothetical protein